MKLSIKDMCYIAVSTALICVVSQISVPMPAGVPMTLQTLIIPLVAAIIGTKRGTISTVLYVLLGAVGVPVFAGMTGGFEIVAGMTGGFIVSFPILALCAGLGYTLAGKSGKKGAPFYTVFVLGLVVGAAINYVFGTVWFSAFTGNSFGYSFAVCVAPFIVTSIIKIALVAIISPVIRGAMVKSGVLEVSTR